MIEATTNERAVQIACDRIAAITTNRSPAPLYAGFSFRRHMLDVSCGAGIDAVFLAQAGIRVTGIDILPEMIARFRERVAATNLEALVAVDSGRPRNTFKKCVLDGGRLRTTAPFHDGTSNAPFKPPDHDPALAQRRRVRADGALSKSIRAHHQRGPLEMEAEGASIRSGQRMACDH